MYLVMSLILLYTPNLPQHLYSHYCTHHHYLCCYHLIFLYQSHVHPLNVKCIQMDNLDHFGTNHYCCLRMCMCLVYSHCLQIIPNCFLLMLNLMLIHHCH